VLCSIGYGRIDWVFAQAPAEAWERISAGDGAKGPRLYDWARARMPVAIAFDGDVFGRGHWVLARRSISEPDQISCYLCYAPEETPLSELVRASHAHQFVRADISSVQVAIPWSVTAVGRAGSTNTTAATPRPSATDRPRRAPGVTRHPLRESRARAACRRVE
jgi:hypothetical protein